MKKLTERERDLVVEAFAHALHCAITVGHQSRNAAPEHRTKAMLMYGKGLIADLVGDAKAGDEVLRFIAEQMDSSRIVTAAEAVKF